ncbi:MAG: ComEC/Rec2 family competence protein [Patescibacteria group bacterium]
MDQTYPSVKKIYWQSLLILAALVALTYLAYFSLRPDWHLRVSFYDIGQGDAAFITTYQGNQILIDGGPGSNVLEKMGREMPFYDREIDLIILSHPHADHLSGLIEVLKRYKVKKVLYTKVTHSSAVYKIFEDLVKEKNIETIIAAAGQKIILDDATVIKLLYPPQSLQGQLFDDLNESSIVARLVFGRSSFLFTGDAPKEEEREILASGQTVAADVLKVGHHGSKNATSQEFLAAVGPEFAVISAGRDNRYGHPHAATLQALESAGAKVFRTDTDGDVKFVSDGANLTKL